MAAPQPTPWPLLTTDIWDDWGAAHKSAGGQLHHARMNGAGITVEGRLAVGGVGVARIKIHNGRWSPVHDREGGFGALILTRFGTRGIGITPPSAPAPPPAPVEATS